MSDEKRFGIIRNKSYQDAQKALNHRASRLLESIMDGDDSSVDLKDGDTIEIKNGIYVWTSAAAEYEDDTK